MILPNINIKNNSIIHMIVLVNKMLFLNSIYLFLKLYKPVPIEEFIPNPIKHVIINTHEWNKEKIPNCSLPNSRVNIGVVIKATP